MTVEIDLDDDEMTHPKFPRGAKAKWPDNIQLSLEWLDKTTALAFLATSIGNRPLPWRKLDYLTRQLTKWSPWIALIVFDEEGHLIDGNGRLTAIAKAGARVAALVVRGVPSEARPYIDTGKSRNGPDALILDGFKFGGGYASLAAAARAVRCFELKKTITEIVIDHEDLLDVVHRHEALASYVMKLYETDFSKSGVIMAALYWIAMTQNPKAEDFISKVLSGAEITHGSPIWLLRHKFHSMRTARERDRERGVRMVFQAWRAYEANKARLTFFALVSPSSPKYPWPIGAPYLVDESQSQEAQ